MNKGLRIVVLTIIILGFLGPNLKLVDAYQSSASISSISQRIEEIGNFLNFYLFKKGKSELNQDEIIFWTNTERQNLGLAVLEKDLELNRIAEIKLSDMEEKQYFDHYSPEGRGISDEASDSGYKYISIGENLAQGNFKDSKDLVEAWMKSPGHRENILKSQYNKIGIAAEKVTFEGKKTWLAVQVFSKPLSECMEPSISLKNSIDREKRILQDLFETTNSTFSKMSNAKQKGNIEIYNKLVPEYNSLVNQVNDQTSVLQNEISEYNREVNAFNVCLES